MTSSEFTQAIRPPLHSVVYGSSNGRWKFWLLSWFCLPLSVMRSIATQHGNFTASAIRLLTQTTVNWRIFLYLGYIGCRSLANYMPIKVFMVYFSPSKRCRDSILQCACLHVHYSCLTLRTYSSRNSAVKKTKKHFSSIIIILMFIFLCLMNLAADKVPQNKWMSTV
jgi:hypothetical protein